MSIRKDLVPGEHIKVHRIGYTHHGIYIGNDQVIHYTGEVFQKVFSENQPKIRQDHISVFSNGNKIKRVHHSKTFFYDQIITRAQSKLGESRYSLIFNNCEHFATWCVTGQYKSEQVEKRIAGTSPISFVIYKSMKWFLPDD